MTFSSLALTVAVVFSAAPTPPSKTAKPAPASVEAKVVPTSVAPTTVAAPPETKHEVWVGHQVLTGSRSVPVFGDVETRTDNFVVADVQRTGNRVEAVVRACRVQLKPVMGVDMVMSQRTVSHLPPSRMVLNLGNSSAATADPWVLAWGEQDIDRDGAPGITVAVDAPMCDGAVHVANRSVSYLGNNRIDDQGFFGEMTVQVHQRVLGVTSSCLRWGGGDTKEVQRGRFVFRRVADGTTCASLDGRMWPVLVSSGK